MYRTHEVQRKFLFVNQGEPRTVGTSELGHSHPDNERKPRDWQFEEDDNTDD